MMTADFCDRWMNKFAELKQIKCPDNGKIRLLTHYYPTERYLKKNNRKLVSSVLDRFKAKSKITIKILHLFPNTNIRELVILCRLLGEDYPKYIGNINPRFFYDNNKDETDISVKHYLLEVDDPHFREIFDVEKENIIKIINDTLDNNTQDMSHGIVSSIMDHFDMLERSHTIYPELRLTSRTMNTFHEEHINLARLAQQIKTGYSIRLVFDDDVIRTIEKPFQISYLPTIYRVDDFVYEKTFKPKLLRTSEEYFEEGSYMHNCVAGYINSSHRSIIVSLRCGSDRVTCEFDIRSKKCQQSRYFTNDPPPAYFEKALDNLKNRINRMSYQIDPIDKIKVPLLINGIEMKVEEIEEQLF
jgi:hypothetical protein